MSSHASCPQVIESREMQAPGLNPDSIDGAVRVAHLVGFSILVSGDEYNVTHPFVLQSVALFVIKTG